MKILHTITYTKYSKYFQSHVEHTLHLTRNRRLTYRGLQRMFRTGCFEFAADPDVCVTRVETAVYAR